MLITRRFVLGSSGLISLAAVGRGFPVLAQQSSPAVQAPSSSQARPTAEELNRLAIERRAIDAIIWGIPILSFDAMRQAYFRDAQCANVQRNLNVNRNLSAHGNNDYGTSL
jgi:hypothetical protein